MSEHSFNVLFLCTGNSARSIMAEVLLNAVGHGRFRAFSAGSMPRGEVHPLTYEVLKGFSVDGLRSKSWDEFAVPGAPTLDFVFTVCDRAAAEVCPVWPGQPISAHWGVEDPAAATGSRDEQIRAFRTALMYLSNRVRAFANLPIEGLDRLSLQREVERIGKLPPR